MKKTLLIVLALAAMTLNGIAQKDKLKYAKVTYLALPWDPQDPQVNTFSATVKNYGRLSYVNLTAAELANSIQLGSFTKIEKGPPEMKVLITIPSFDTPYPKRSSSTNDQGVTSWYYSYETEIKMSYKIWVKGKDLNPDSGKLFKLEKTNTANKFSWKSGTFPSSQKASEYYNSKGKTEFKAAFKNFVVGRFNAQVNAIQNQVDYFVAQKNMSIIYFKSTKKKDFTDYEKAADGLIAALGNINATSNRDAYKTEVKPTVDFFQSRIKTLSPTSKDTRNLYLGCALNLSTAYFWMEDFANAEKYLAMANDIKGRNGVKGVLQRLIPSRKAELEAVKGAGVDPYKGIKPASQEELEEIRKKGEAEEAERQAIAEQKAAERAARIEIEKEKLRPVIDTYEGFIIGLDGNKQGGKFELYGKNTGADEGKVFFLDGKQKREISESFMKSCEFGPHKYIVKKYLNSRGIRSKDVMKVLYDSDKIQCLEHKYLDSEGKVVKNIHYFRPDEDRTINTTNPAFMVAYKKKMSNYFQDCPALVAKIEAGEFPKSEEMRVALATEYALNCK